MQGPRCPRPPPPFHPCLPVRFLDPHPTSFRLAVASVLRRSSDGSAKSPSWFRPILTLQCGCGDRGGGRSARLTAVRKRCPEPRRRGLEGGACGGVVGAGAKGPRGEGPVELAEGGGALIDLWVGGL